ncbi:MAG: MFS transporter [Alphaproteobacteria bacterium]
MRPEQNPPQTWKRPAMMLFIMAAAMAISLNGWMALLNNFAIERVNFDGQKIGILQGIREIPGFLSFGVIFIILFIREQKLAILALILLGLGTALTGFFPALLPLYMMTFMASVGFHYYEAVQQSLTLQLIDKKDTPAMLGQQMGFVAMATIAVYCLIIVATDPAMILSGLDFFFDASAVMPAWFSSGLDYKWVYLIAGAVTVAAAIFVAFAFPIFKSPHVQHKHLLLRKRYWLYYALVFMSGARRQIFIVFAAFMMVEKFGYSAAEVTLLFLINHLVNIKLAPLIGKLIAKWGERKALIFEYSGLVLVFTTYAFVETAWLAGTLYVIDHMFFAFAIAIKTYFQKIADPQDMASTAGVSFTINHIAAVIIPPIFGIIWLFSPATVFLLGSAMAMISLYLSCLVPQDPRSGQEVTHNPRLVGFLLAKIPTSIGQKQPSG